MYAVCQRLHPIDIGLSGDGNGRGIGICLKFVLHLGRAGGDQPNAALGPSLLCALYLSDIQQGFTLFSPYNRYDLDTSASRGIKLQVEIVRKGQKTGEIRAGDPVMMVRAFLAAVTGVALAWSSGGGVMDEKEELRKVFDIIF
ncbi:MAG: hypothetical protein LUF28_00525 [Clostridiales bacterium]|nr:hypothetical protein [Clostridiales bacterium]